MIHAIRSKIGTPSIGKGKSASLLLWLVAIVFVFSNSISLSLHQTGAIQWGFFVGPLVWLLAYGMLFALLHYFDVTVDPYILPAISLLTGWGILLVHRLAANFFWRQVVWVVLGTAVIGFILLIPRNLNWLRRYRYTLLFVGLLLMAATFFFGVNPSGASVAHYWLQFPFAIPIFFQPSELLKLLLVIFLASYLDDQEAMLFTVPINKHSNLLALIAPITIMGGFCLLLLVWQQDLGAATLFFILFLTLFYTATGKKNYLLTGVILLLIAGAFAYWQFGLVALRVDAWLNPWTDADGGAFQIVQSLYAIASGGVFGQGIGQGFPTYIPVVHSDFVFAAIAEEWGLLGGLTILFCLALFAHRGLMIALWAKRPFHRYLAVGIVALLTAQAILIMGGVSKLLPLTGVTLPFVSYGGSSMLISHIMVGLLLYLSKTPQTKQPFTTPSQHHIRHIHTVLLAILGAIALMLFYWTLIRSPAIAQREDNPRTVEAALRIQRGTILDSQSTVIAQTVGNDNQLTRTYPVPEIGPAVGYYSFRHGTSGVESGLNNVLSGSGSTSFFEQGLLHRPMTGKGIQLTIDAELQLLANEQMANQRGAILLFRQDEATNDLLDIVVMGSYPSYDSNLIDDQFDQLIEAEDAPLLNRTTLGQYQPGMILQPFVLATAVDQQEIVLTEPVTEGTIDVTIDGQTLTCVGQAEPDSWDTALVQRCPGPMSRLGALMGSRRLTQSFANFGLTQPITLPLELEETAVTPVESPALAAIGQDSLTISPMVLGRAWVGLLNNGRLPQFRLVSHIQEQDGEWVEQDVANPITGETAVQSSSATAIMTRLPQYGDNGVEFVATAVAGPDNSNNSWYLGQQTIDNITYYVVIVLEESTDVEAISKIGHTLLEAVQNQ